MLPFGLMPLVSLLYYYNILIPNPNLLKFSFDLDICFYCFDLMAFKLRVKKICMSMPKIFFCSHKQQQVQAGRKTDCKKFPWHDARDVYVVYPSTTF